MKLVNVTVGKVVDSTQSPIDSDRTALVEVLEEGFTIGIICPGNWPREKSLTLTPEAFTHLLVAMLEAKRKYYGRKFTRVYRIRYQFPEIEQ